MANIEIINVLKEIYLKNENALIDILYNGSYENIDNLHRLDAVGTIRVISYSRQKITINGVEENPIIVLKAKRPLLSDIPDWKEEWTIAHFSKSSFRLRFSDGGLYSVSAQSVIRNIGLYKLSI